MTQRKLHSYTARQEAVRLLARGGELDEAIADPASLPPEILVGKVSASTWWGMRSGLRYRVLYDEIAGAYDARRVVIDDPETLRRVKAARDHILASRRPRKEARA